MNDDRMEHYWKTCTRLARHLKINIEYLHIGRYRLSYEIERRGTDNYTIGYVGESKNKSINNATRFRSIIEVYIKLKELTDET